MWKKKGRKKKETSRNVVSISLSRSVTVSVRGIPGQGPLHCLALQIDTCCCCCCWIATNGANSRRRGHTLCEAYLHPESRWLELPPPSLASTYPYATHETCCRCCDQSKSGGRVFVALFSFLFLYAPMPPPPRAAACSTTLRPFF